MIFYDRNRIRNIFREKISVKCIDGDIVEGMCEIFTPALDNEPEVAEIALKPEHYKRGFISIKLPEIETIEEI